MTASIVASTSDLSNVTYAVTGEVRTYAEQGGLLHWVHESACLKCGETEAWIAPYARLIGVITSPVNGGVAYVTL